MVNYEARIAALKAKGVLDEKDAGVLESSLGQKMIDLPKQRRYTLEGIGLLILGILFVYLTMKIGMAESSGGIEEVGQTLNDTRAGVGTSHTFLLLTAGFFVAAFVGFYLLVHHYYNALWRTREQMVAAGTLIADLQERQAKMHEMLQQLSSQTEGAEKTSKTAMQIIAELDRELGELQQIYTALQASCRQKQKAFVYTLAAVVGTLPKCQ